MYEDAFCSNPCGAEPAGCGNCDLVTGKTYGEHWEGTEMPQLICLECEHEWFGTESECPKCGCIDMEDIS